MDPQTAAKLSELDQRLRALNQQQTQAQAAIDAAQAATAALTAATAATNAAAAPNRRIQLPTICFTKENEDWVLFRRQFELQCQLLGYDNLTACRALASCMRGEAGRIIQDIKIERSNDQDQHILIADLLSSYEARFLPEAASGMTITAFEQASQTRDESVLHWHGRCRDLYLRAYPRENNVNDSVTLIRKFIEGTFNKTIKYHLTRSRPATYVAALERAQDERAALISNSMMTVPKHQQPSYQLADEATPMEIGAIGTNSKPPIQCYRCGNTGHMRRECVVKPENFKVVSSTGTRPRQSSGQKFSQPNRPRADWPRNRSNRAPNLQRQRQMNDTRRQIQELEYQLQEMAVQEEDGYNEEEVESTVEDDAIPPPDQGYCVEDGDEAQDF